MYANIRISKRNTYGRTIHWNVVLYSFCGITSLICVINLPIQMTTICTKGIWKFVLTQFDFILLVFKCLAWLYMYWLTYFIAYFPAYFSLFRFGSLFAVVAFALLLFWLIEVRGDNYWQINSSKAIALRTEKWLEEWTNTIHVHRFRS